MADTKCYLLELPAELRTSIWELVLQPFTKSVAVGRRKDIRYPRTGPPPLMEVNQTIRSETLAMYYSQTTFDLGGLSRPQEAHEDFGDWLHSIGDDAVHHLRRLRVGGCSWMFPLRELGYRAVDIMPTSEAAVMSWQVRSRRAGLPILPTRSDAYLKAVSGPLAKHFEAEIEVEIREVQKRLEDGGLSSRDWRGLLRFVDKWEYSWVLASGEGSTI
ncbi:hypothetical protein LTR56_015204 [Elasticomyces elasticus]|nr:hypothetical protein LTR56_015204 [Elasticomyces elasticus]KAK3644498.1 hypothetical protein LTR22_015218 [Elasticomyces elasticus]KAK4915535.1 hypothetical protein LTR49_016382 [Elasticomyces elasticus]KAK5756252.1 hypothetical protein LTS12_013676 [Elasticomyces elasticus]